MKVEINEGCHYVNKRVDTIAGSPQPIIDYIRTITTGASKVNIPRNSKEEIKRAKKEFKKIEGKDTPLRMEIIEVIVQAAIPKWGSVIVKLA